jgi:hypothetical protein
MPFDLCSDPAAFERLTETVLRGLTYDPYIVYLDNVIVISRTFQKHFLNLGKVFERFREARLNSTLENVNSCRKKYGTSGILYHRRVYLPTLKN